MASADNIRTIHVRRALQDPQHWSAPPIQLGEKRRRPDGVPGPSAPDVKLPPETPDSVAIVPLPILATAAPSGSDASLSARDAETAPVVPIALAAQEKVLESLDLVEPPLTEGDSSPLHFSLGAIISFIGHASAASVALTLALPMTERPPQIPVEIVYEVPTSPKDQLPTIPASPEMEARAQITGDDDSSAASEVGISVRADVDAPAWEQPVLYELSVGPGDDLATIPASEEAEVVARTTTADVATDDSSVVSEVDVNARSDVGAPAWEQPVVYEVPSGPKDDLPRVSASEEAEVLGPITTADAATDGLVASEVGMNVRVDVDAPAWERPEPNIKGAARVDEGGEILAGEGSARAVRITESAPAMLSTESDSTVENLEHAAIATAVQTAGEGHSVSGDRQVVPTAAEEAALGSKGVGDRQISADDGDQTIVGVEVRATSSKNVDAPSSVRAPPAKAQLAQKPKSKLNAKRSAAAYAASLTRHLRRKGALPAAERGFSSTVIVIFTIDKAGRASRIRLLASTGSRTLDEKVRAAVRRASPFPAIPKELGMPSFIVRAPVQLTKR